MIERPDMMDENLTVDLPTWYANLDRIFAAVADWAKDKTVAEIVEFGQLLRIAVTPVVRGDDVLADEQLAARDWWERDGDIAYPGQPFHFSQTPSKRRGAAPEIGVTTDAAPAVVARSATGNSDRAAARGTADHRGDGELGRPGGRTVPRRPRRRRHQDRMGHPPGDAGAVLGGTDQGSAAPAVAPGDVLQRAEPQQAQHLLRPVQARRQGRVPRAGQDRRHRAGEQQRPRDAQPRPRLRRRSRRSTRHSSWCRCPATAPTGRAATGWPTGPTSRRPAR